MSDLRRFNVRLMIVILALKDNNFHMGNASLDLGINQSNLVRTITRIQKYFDYPLFDLGTRKYCGNKLVICDFTEKGNELYQSAKLFLNSLDCMGAFDVEDVK